MKAEVQSFLELISRRTSLSLHPECVFACFAAGLPLHPSAEEAMAKGAGGISWGLGGGWTCGDRGDLP